jgi:hypothetical protein
MFKCEKCGKISNPGETSNKVVVEKRDKTYRYKKDKVEMTSHGWEIKKEIIVCDECNQ